MKLTINVDIYSAKVIFVTKFEEIKKLHKNADKAQGFVTINYTSHIYVYVNNEFGSMLDYRYIQCLSHEMNHAAMCILGNVGVRFGFDNQEPLCYLQDFLLSRVYKEIVKHENNLHKHREAEIV